MNPTFIIVLIVIFIIFWVIKGLANRPGADAGLYKNVALVDWETGYSCDIDIDYNDPSNIIKADPQTGKLFVPRKAGFADKGDKKVWLTFHKVKEYHGWTFILNNAKALADDVIKEMKQLREQVIYLTNLVNEKETRIIELETKMREEFGHAIKLQTEMNEASRKGIVFKQTGGKQ